MVGVNWFRGRSPTGRLDRDPVLGCRVIEILSVSGIERGVTGLSGAGNPANPEGSRRVLGRRRARAIEDVALGFQSQLEAEEEAPVGLSPHKQFPFHLLLLFRIS